MITEVRSRKSEVRSQKPEAPPTQPPRGGRAREGLKVFALCPLLFALCLMSSSARAVSWNPETVLKTHLKNNYPWAEIEIRDLLLSAEIPDELPDRIMVEKGPPGKTVFLMEFKNGKKIKAIANVKAFDWIVMSRRAFRKYYFFQKDDIYITMMDVMRIPKGAIKDTERVIGKPLNRSIVANIPIVDNMVSETPLVKKGRKVVLLVESPGFRITTIGETKQNSYVGGYVKAVNLGSKKVIKGLLIDENTVKVGF